jgi:hypothetical protein
MDFRIGLATFCTLLALGCASEPPPAVQNSESVFDQLTRERKEADRVSPQPANAPRDDMYKKILENQKKSGDAQRRLLQGENPNAVLKDLGNGG